MEFALSYSYYQYSHLPFSTKKSDYGVKLGTSIKFISGMISTIIQKNMLCTNKFRVIYFCPNSVICLPGNLHFFYFLMEEWLPLGPPSCEPLVKMPVITYVKLFLSLTFLLTCLRLFKWCKIGILLLWTQKCAVSLANQVKAVEDAFRPLRTHQRYWTSDCWTSQKWSPSNRQHTACGESRKYIQKLKEIAHNDGNRAPLLNSFQKLCSSP